MTTDTFLKLVAEAAHRLPPPDMSPDFIHISPPFCFKPTTSFDETTNGQTPAWELVAADGARLQIVVTSKLKLA